MERLTQRSNGFIQLIGTGTKISMGCTLPILKGTMKLADYEDTGLTPEEIKSDNEVFKAYRHICGGRPPEDIEKALKLLDAEEQGLLIKFPCKVGDTIYYVSKRFKEITEYTVMAFIVEPDTVMVDVGATSNVNAKLFGKIMFTTRDAAEQALKGSTPS